MAAVVIAFLAVGSVAAGTAHAHSLDSSTMAIVISDDGVTASFSIALATIDEALDTDFVDESDVDTYAPVVVDYLDDHLTVTGADDATWTTTFSSPARSSVEGIESFTVDAAFDVGTSDVSEFEVELDAIVDAVPGHEFVVVLTDSVGEISTVGVLTADQTQVNVTDGVAPVPAVDMIGYGFDHVLEGADHLLFLITLLLPAPLVVADRRWRRGPGLTHGLRHVTAVVTAFTVGHSLTLLASALGWVDVPARPVEILIAVSVGASAIHAIRPVARHGEAYIAFGFGLVHGLAFAGILADLGLTGGVSVRTLLAFNVGVELAGLATTAATFPSLYALSLTRWYPVVRMAGATVALLMATAWVADRVGVLSNPFAAIESTAVAHPVVVVVALAIVATVALVADRQLARRPPRRPPRTGITPVRTTRRHRPRCQPRTPTTLTHSRNIGGSGRRTPKGPTS